MLKAVGAMCLFFAFGCASQPPVSSQEKTVQKEKLLGLSHEYAQIRFQEISNVKYFLSLDLDSQGESFHGETDIIFDYKPVRETLEIDFWLGSVGSVFINDQQTSGFTYDGYTLKIPKSLLKVGTNSVRVVYSHPYSIKGSGLHRSIDPLDKRAYLFTHLEPFSANQVFPCFDQPDIKATYILSVKVPKSWVVISSVRESGKSRLSDGKTLWSFPESAKFSTYLISIHAGDYHVWEDRSGTIPLRLFARKSMAKYVPHKEWFSLSHRGLRFFNDYFGYNYPFKKYDQLIVPDFRAGAMENVAAVTFSERYLSRGPLTTEKRKSLASTLLHEMAHMWFGNIVTMKWWDDLWLNESFATYMAKLGLENATDFENIWLDFHASSKGSAYYLDGLSTTHPIVASVENTSQAFTNFDAITYGKGASVLKQLSFYLGENQFRRGVQKYILENQYGNAELKHFLAALQKTAKVDLIAWSKDWLESAGRNAVTVDYSCGNDGKIASFSILQAKDPFSNRLRPHKTTVRLYQMNPRGQLHNYASQEVSYLKDTQVSAFVGMNCPAFVFPNADDHDYVKVVLDSKSLQFIKSNIHLLTSPLDRLMVFSSLWSHVTDGAMDPREYWEVSLKQLRVEKDLPVVEAIWGTLSKKRAINYMAFLPESTPEEKQEKLQAYKQLEDLAWLQASKVSESQDFRLTWLDFFVSSVTTRSGAEKAKALLKGSRAFPKKFIDQDRRWILVRKLRAVNDRDAQSLLEFEKTRDKSHAGAREALGAEVSLPDLSVKRKWFREVLDHNHLYSFEQLKSIIYYLFPENQLELKLQFTQDFYSSLDQVALHTDPKFQAFIASRWVPTACTRGTEHSLSQFLGQKKFPSSIQKSLKAALSEEQICVKVREKMLSEERKPAST